MVVCRAGRYRVGVGTAEPAGAGFVAGLLDDEQRAGEDPPGPGAEAAPGLDRSGLSAMGRIGHGYGAGSDRARPGAYILGERKSVCTVPENCRAADAVGVAVRH